MSDNPTQPHTEERLAQIHTQCERALRRLRVLASERDDVLLGYALDAVWRASVLSSPPQAPTPV